MSNKKNSTSSVVANEYLDLARQRVENAVSLMHALERNVELLSRTVEVAEVVSATLRSHRKVLLFGNGGSAADAQHIAAELVGRYKRDRRALPALALTVNTSCLTAIGNDYTFDQVFSRQVEAFGVPGDVIIGISTSGTSKNVLEGVKAGKEKGIATVGFTGESGGRGPLKSIVDYCLAVPSNDTPRIQESHILLGHIICEIVEQKLFSD
jgi:D-sedoheptulose 7-phosphate isomerase